KKVFTGTLSCSIDIDKLIKSYITPYDVRLGSFTWIINSNHEVVAHSNFELIGKHWEKVVKGSILNPNPDATDHSDEDKFLSAIFSGKPGMTQAKLDTLGDDNQLIAYVPLYVANAQWVVISHTPRKAVLEPF